MTGTETGRLAFLLRWLGLTMVFVLVLQLAAVLVGIDWSAEATSPQIAGPLVALAPLGFIGLLTCLIGSRLENPQQQVTPLRAVVCVLSASLAIGMIVAVPMSLNSGAGDLSQAQNIEQGRAAMKEARAFRDNPEQVASLGEQLAQAGQLAADASKDDKQRAAKTMIDEQISQMGTQLIRLESQKNRESRQRLIGGTATAVVLAVAFVLLALTAVI